MGITGTFSVIDLILLRKNFANSLLFIVLLLMDMLSGKEDLFWSLAILTASQSDFELPGRIPDVRFEFFDYGNSI